MFIYNVYLFIKCPKIFLHFLKGATREKSLGKTASENRCIVHQTLAFYSCRVLKKDIK